MNAKIQTKDSTTLHLPLLRSIARELTERTRSVNALQARLSAFESTRHIHQEDVAGLEAELMIERREIRHAHEELERLGYKVDHQDGGCLVLLDQDGKAALSTSLEEGSDESCPSTSLENAG